MFSTKQNRNSQTVQNLTVITDKVSVLSSCFLNWYLLILIFSVVTLISWLSHSLTACFLPHCLHRIWTTCSALSNTQLLMSRVKKLKSHSPCDSCIYHIFLYLCTFKRIWRGFMRIHAFFSFRLVFQFFHIVSFRTYAASLTHKCICRCTKWQHLLSAATRLLVKFFSFHKFAKCAFKRRHVYHVLE